MQIVLLCGGEGSRLGDYTKSKPKGLIDINNKPFMKYLLSSISNQKPKSIHFCLGKFSNQYINFFKNENIEFDFTYSIENENYLLGTGGAIKNAISYLENDFIVQYGDTILNINYGKLLNYHINNGKKMTMSILSANKIKDEPNVLCIKNKEGQFKCLYDKEKFKKNGNFIDYGANVFNKKIFLEALPEKFDLSLIQKKLTKKNDCSFYEVENKYIEIGNKESLKLARSLIKNV